MTWVPQSWSFGAPGRLLVLVVVLALALAYLLLQRRRPAYEARFSDLELLATVLPKRPGWRRHVPAALLVLALTALTVAFAQPRGDVRVPRERATIVIALDTSASMLATDVEPDRFTAAQAAASRFVRTLPATFDVALVQFSGATAVVVPPTQDHPAVERAIGGLQLGPGTAIGDAVAASLSAARSDPSEGPPPPTAIVLLSDGANTLGRSIEEAAAQAVQADVPVSTIAYGTPRGTVELRGTQVPVPVDARALAQLAERTEGQAYTAADGDELAAVYADIGRAVGTRVEHRDLTAPVTGVGLALALCAAAASLVWFRALP